MYEQTVSRDEGHVDTALGAASESSRVRLSVSVILLLTAIALLWSTRGGWLDPIIDAGRDLYFPRQILHGEKLYRDFVYFYPPAAPYVLALLTALFGSSLASYTFFGIAISAATVALASAIAYRVAGFRAAATAALFFVTCSMTGASTWGANFVFPFAYAATLGIAATLAFVLMLIAYIERRSTALLVAMTLCGTTATFLKFDFGLVIAGCALVAIVWNRVPLLFGAALLVSHATAALFTELYFHDSASYSHWLYDNALAASRLSGTMSQFFYSQVFGSADAAGSLMEISLSVIGILGALAIAVIADRRLRAKPSPAVVIVALLLISGIAVSLAGPRFFRGWAVLPLVLVPLALKEGRRSAFPLLIAASVLSSIRILLNLSPDWYGFYLAIPLYVLIASALFGLLPARGILRRSSALLLLPLIVASPVWYAHQQLIRYEQKRFPVVTPEGVFFDHNSDRAEILNQFFSFLGKADAKEIAVFPEGITLSYLSRTTTPIRFHTFTPIETATPAVEERILRQLQAAPPERVVIVTRDVGEFGFRGFGVDYDLRIAAWLSSEYQEERAWQSDRFSLILLRHR